MNGRLFITEFAYLAGAGVALGPTNAAAPCPQEPAAERQCIEFSEMAGTSAPFKDGTRFIRIHTDATCSIAFGRQAQTEDDRLVANQTEFRGVTAGMTLSVVANT